MRILTVFVTGIIVGLLVAPDKGVNTRRELSRFIALFTGEDEETDKRPITSDDVINS